MTQKPETKPQRKLVALSTKLAAMAAIEGVMNGLDPKDRPAVAAWFKSEYQDVFLVDPTRDSPERG